MKGELLQVRTQVRPTPAVATLYSDITIQKYGLDKKMPTNVVHFLGPKRPKLVLKMVGCLPLGWKRRWGRREGGLRRSAAAPLSFRTSWPHKSSAPYLFVSSFQSQNWSSPPLCTCGVQYCRGVLGVLPTPTTLAAPTACSHDLTRPSNLATLGTVEQCAGASKHWDPPPAKYLLESSNCTVCPGGRGWQCAFLSHFPKLGVA